MDILDIDEALKDDSFIFLEDKTHDDVSNILQQWKSNNCGVQQHQQAYKLNSRTFTRPKRKSAQNLESHFSNNALYNSQQHNGTPVLNLEIGGLVTTMQKSFLQDTSPPSSICSSMDVSIDRMNNSLITSADFTNVNFLQSTNGLDFNDALNAGFNFTNLSTNDGYTLSDMIRDRKALESLTMSGDGTLTKDCNIAQIDDISLALSKTASGCSTMDNSTESVEANQRAVDRTYEYLQVQPKLDAGVMHKTIVLSDEMIGDTTFNLVENSMYSEQTNRQSKDNRTEVLLNVTQDIQSSEQRQSVSDETFKKPTALDETISLTAKAVNTTFECQDQHTPDAGRCETPESVQKTSAALKFYESTPQQAASMRCNKQQYAPSLRIVDDVNISPIIAPNAQLNATRHIFNETFEKDQKITQINSETFFGALPQFETLELLDNIENPNGTYSKNGTYQRLELEQSEAGTAMQNVMDLAQAEAELLAGNDDDEEEFEHMLDELSKVELNAEQLKMKKSLDSIKKRFNYSGSTGEKQDRELSREAQDMRDMMRNKTELSAEGGERDDVRTKSANSTMEMRGNEIKKLRDSMRESRELKTSFKNSRDLKESMLDSKEFMKVVQESSLHGLTSSTISSTASGNSSACGERLLSRRSRLYDDINLSTLSMQSEHRSPTATTTLNTQRNESDCVLAEDVQQESQETQAAEVIEKTETRISDKSETIKTIIEATTAENQAAAHRLAEKRERDRDRFKTIKIVRQQTTDGGEEDSGERLNVPCIDDDDDMLSQPVGETTTASTELSCQELQRMSRRDHSSPEVVQEKKPTTSNANNYLTYKKPKDKLVRPNLPEITAYAEEETAPPASTRPRLEPRSLSRPRYMSGLQKFSVVSKATSAGDLERTTCGSKAGLNLTLNSNQHNTAKVAMTTASNFNRTQPIVVTGNCAKELKSPMGIKSKSFHNLSSNFGYAGAGSGGGAVLTQKTNAYGLKKANNTAGILTEKQAKVNPMRTNSSAKINRTLNQAQQQQEKTDETVFKVPKLVSGIRATGPAGAIKRAGLVRPSSGYYSLNVTATAAKNVSQTAEIDFDAGRHSPTDSMSSASSRSSVQSVGSSLKPVLITPTVADHSQQLPITLTKITTGSTGIPKPSGLRPPSNVKRSGLPRPASIVRR